MYWDSDSDDDSPYTDFRSDHVFELKGPPGSCPLWDAPSDPRNITKFEYPSKTETPDIVWEEDAIRCPNDLLLHPDWVIPGYHTMTLKRQSKKLSWCYYWYSRINTRLVKLYNEIIDCLRAREGGLAELSISEFYLMIGNMKSASIFEESLAKQFSVMTSRESVQDVMDKLDFEDPDKDYSRFPVKTKVEEFDRHWYLDLAATHLFLICNATNPRFASDPKKFRNQDIPELPPSPTAIALFGHELWFLMNLAHPRLNRLYQEVIAPVVRPREVEWAQSYMFTGGESFAIDFWQAWVEAIKGFSAKFQSWFRVTYHRDSMEPDLESLRSEMKSICKIPDDQPVTTDHLERYKSGMYLMAGSMSSNPIRYDLQDFVRVAFQIKLGEDGINRSF